MRRKSKKLIIFWASITAILSFLVPIGMTAFKEEGKIVSNWENVIDYQGIPKGWEAARPLDYNPFSDMGAWHAYTLPTVNDKDVLGGFGGPLYVDKAAGRYLSRSFNVLKIVNSDNNKEYNFSTLNEKNIHLKSFPGGLWQEYIFGDFNLELELRFVTDKTALIKTRIINTSKNALKLNVSWSGTLFGDNPHIITKNGSYAAFDKTDLLPTTYNGVSVDFGKPRTPYEIGKPLIATGAVGNDRFAVEDWKYQIQINEKNAVSTNFSNDGLTYNMAIKDSIQINANEQYDIFQTNSFTFTKNERGIDETVEDMRGRTYAYNPNDRRSTYLANGEYEKTRLLLATDEAANTAFSENATRWEKYISDSIGGDVMINEPYQKGAIKSIQTLIMNWRGHAGYLARQGITPSLSMDYFNGFWTWDSWKQAVAAVNFEPDLAKDNIRTLFDWQARDTEEFNTYYGDKLRSQRDMGMVPDYIAFRKSETNWRDTKPPLAAWAVWTVYEKTGDKDFLAEMYKKLLAYHNWWYKNRDNDRNAILEYGGTVHEENNSVSAILEAAGWESGLDNAPRFDINGYSENDKGIEILENTNAQTGLLVGYSINQESVCLNSYAYAEKLYLANMARTLNEGSYDYNEVVANLDDGLAVNDMSNYQFKESVPHMGLQLGTSWTNDISQLETDAEYVKNYVSQYMYDSSTGFFYDKEIDTTADGVGKPLVNRGKGSEGWIPLWANIATADQAKGVKKAMMKRTTFNNKVPFGSASIDNPKFAPNQYWRGPVWLDQAYYAVVGLTNYGYGDLAQRQSIKIMDNIEGYTKKGYTIRETYNPLTGAGQDAKNFSWSAGMLYLMYLDHVKAG